MQKRAFLVVFKIINMIFSKHLFLIFNCQKNVLHGGFDFLGYHFEILKEARDGLVIKA